MIDLNELRSWLDKAYGNLPTKKECYETIGRANLKAAKERDELKAKFAEIEAQEPLKFAWKHDYGLISNVVFDHWDDVNDSWKGKAEGKVVSLYTQPKPTQRITEQDAIEIIDEYKHWKLHVSFTDSSEEQFFKEKEGIGILAKLNEHREPVAAEQLALVTAERDGYLKHRDQLLMESPHWVEIENPEDAPTDNNLVLWDGCDLSVDYVENEVEFGTSFFANGTKATHYLSGLTLPKSANEND